MSASTAATTRPPGSRGLAHDRDLRRPQALLADRGQVPTADPPVPQRFAEERGTTEQERLRRACVNGSRLSSQRVTVTARQRERPAPRLPGVAGTPTAPAETEPATTTSAARRVQAAPVASSAGEAVDAARHRTSLEDRAGPPVQAVPPAARAATAATQVSPARTAATACRARTAHRAPAAGAQRRSPE